MHIKTGTWESNNAACETDALCDPAVLVSSTTATTTNSEPHIRNRRLSPGSGNGGGGGGCTAGIDQQQQTRRVSPAGTPEGDHQPSGPGSHHASSHHAFAFRGEKEQRRGQQQQRRGGQRREAQRGAGGRAAANDRSQKLHQRERWVGDSLSLLKPPPAFPVQDSPAKLQPAVSYASKVKSGATSAALEEDPPAIGVLLQNQWGLSFISEARPPAEGGRGTAPCPSAASAAAVTTPPPPPSTTDTTESTSPPPPQQPLDEVTVVPAAATSPVTVLGPCPEVDDSNGKLLLSCRHLVEALKYHTREWNAVCNKQKDPKNKVVWYKDPLEQPA